MISLLAPSVAGFIAIYFVEIYFVAKHSWFVNEQLLSSRTVIAIYFVEAKK